MRCLARPLDKPRIAALRRAPISMVAQPQQRDISRAARGPGTARYPVAGVAELVDALDLGSSGESRGGSNPSARTTEAPPDGSMPGYEPLAPHPRQQD